MTYRPEIDGLRALAVAAVVVFHANFSFGGKPVLTGGYLGVDVFFVISGYLITSIVLRELSARNFSILRFYHRRARRILPALFLVLAVCVPFAWRLMPPDQLKAFSGSAVATLLFASNFWFWSEDSYWAGPSELKPLLHTWTLALEEQFYIVCPLLLMALWRSARDRILPILIFLFAASLALSQYGSTAFPDANFFLLPTRAWELLAGAILARIELSYGRNPAGTRAQILPLLGVLMIVGPLFAFDSRTPHPSLLTLIPVIGVCLVIWFARKEAAVTSVLSTRLFVAVGLISYSLYLWHYPVFAFWNLARPEVSNEVSNLGALGLIAVSVLLSVLSYFLVERPARSMTSVPTPAFAPAIAATFLVLAGLGTASYASNGFADRYGGLAALFNETGSDMMGFAGHANPNARGTIFLAGDSHAGVLTKAVSDLAEEHGYGLERRVFGSCVPVDVEAVKFKNCDPYRKETLRIIDNAPPAIVIYAVHWRKYQDRSGRKKYRGTVTPHQGETLRGAYERTFQRWVDAGHRVVLVYPGMETNRNIKEQIKELVDPIPRQERDTFVADLKFEVNYGEQLRRADWERDMVEALAKREGIEAVDPLRVFCQPSRDSCALNEGMSFFITDQSHYSRAAADKIVRAIERELAAAHWFGVAERAR